MFKKQQYLIILFILAIFSFLLARANSSSEVSLLSKKSHAEKLWKISGHANKKAEAFVHWDKDTPPQIPVTCAKCHSTPGFLDFLGADGSTPGIVEKAAPVGTTVECDVCHLDKNRGIVREHTSVTFPSGAKVEKLGSESLCMECHQGRASALNVDDNIAKAAVPDDDTVSKSVSFQNIHYYASAATQFGTVVKGGYQYAGKSYDARFSHITGYNACITCHNPHSLEVELETCNTCHTGVKDPKDIRYFGSFVDYDGDGNMKEGIYYEIQELQDKLYDTIKKYGKDIAGTPIAYDEHTYPYFFRDTNNNGVVDPEEAVSTNRYNAFTGRLLKAAYNYQFSKKDPAGYAHGGKYIIELLYDSIESLNSKLKSYVDMARLARGDEGHFDGSSEAWRHWDVDGAVPSTCAKCHSAEGLPYLIEKGVIDVTMPLSNGLLCTTCHTSPPTVRKVISVKFPSGDIKNLGDASNLCLNCHQGRASKFDVSSAISRSPGPYGFINIHYFPSAAVFFGSEVHAGYESDNKSYVGQKIFANHGGRFDTCVECHMGTKSPNRTRTQSDDLFHNVKTPNPADCVYCHGYDVSQPYPGTDPTKFEFEAIRPGSIPDYDGDGNMRESIREEIEGLENALYAQMQYYATNIGSPILYDEHTYPYFFKDKNGNGIIDPGEATTANRYMFNAPLLRAGYNLHLSKKEPCGFIHNSRYIAQLLVDSIEHLGGNISAYRGR